MDNIFGVYVCTGCDIGESIDIEKVEKVATGEYKVKVCRRHQDLCSQAGIDMIKGDIAREGLNKVVIAACSPRHSSSFYDSFSGAVVESINVREHLAWCHEPNNEDTDMLAEDMMRMGLIKVGKSEPLERFEMPGDFNKSVLVVGGGLAGLTSAQVLAKLGVKVYLVEKQETLGGWANSLAAEVPLGTPYLKPGPSAVPELVKQVQDSGNIEVYLGRTIKEISGAPGMFAVTLSGDESFIAGSIVQATGSIPYDAQKLGHLGYGASPNVITSAQFESLLKDGNLTRPSDGKPVGSVTFIQCAGSRDQEHLPYCSSDCCAQTLKQANLYRQANPTGKAFILYKDIRTPGQMELFYKAVQNDPGIFLTKGRIASVIGNDAGPLQVAVDDTLLGEPISINSDLVVLATGMVTSNSDTENNPILNLTYRQGTDLPEAKYGFPDSEFICFPYETRRTGIYAAGTVRHPMGPAEAHNDALGAALKAYQALELIGDGLAVHPRAMDLSYPDFFLQRCTDCKRCTEECPFGAIDENEKGTPLPNPTRCRRCGICMGACPERIISFKNYSVSMVSGMIKGIDIPEEEAEKPRVLVLVCENDAYPALDILGLNRIKYSPYVRIVPVRCLGSVNVVWINDSLASGFDGVMLFGCKHGDDYQCHFVKGSELAETRMSNVQEKLKQLALESERVVIHEIALTDYDKIPSLIDDFMEVIEEVGPNPFKDM